MLLLQSLLSQLRQQDAQEAEAAVEVQEADQEVVVGQEVTGDVILVQDLIPDHIHAVVHDHVAVEFSEDEEDSIRDQDSVLSERDKLFAVVGITILETREISAEVMPTDLEEMIDKEVAAAVDLEEDSTEASRVVLNVHQTDTFPRNDEAMMIEETRNVMVVGQKKITLESQIWMTWKKF